MTTLNEEDLDEETARMVERFVVLRVATKQLTYRSVSFTGIHGQGTHVVFKNIYRFHIFSHHGGVANFCRLLLRGCFPTFPKIHKLSPPAFSPLSRSTLIKISPVIKNDSIKMNRGEQ